MITRFFKGPKFFPGLALFLSNDNYYDRVQVGKNEEEVSYNEKSGFQRILTLFETKQDQFIHPSVITVVHTTGGALFIAGIYGGISTSRVTFINFIENNEATQFRSHHDAKRLLSDKMFSSFMRGFAKEGFRVAYFVGTFMSAYTLLSVYNNKDTPAYYSVAGSMAGAVYKIPLGPKGMVSGAVFGGIFGGIFGVVRWILIELTNYTEERLRQFAVNRRHYREESYHSYMKEAFEEKEQKLMLEAMQGLDK